MQRFMFSRVVEHQRQISRGFLSLVPSLSPTTVPAMSRFFPKITASDSTSSIPFFTPDFINPKKTLEESLNNLEGLTCNQAEREMYLFPQINQQRLLNTTGSWNLAVQMHNSSGESESCERDGLFFKPGTNNEGEIASVVISVPYLIVGFSVFSVLVTQHIKSFHLFQNDFEGYKFWRK
ncbi:unnamed protein product [Arabidopsis thaliana]|uniref:(thale cress) hypothetical protein n=1 Tax=Arabidopsis thaliana TaxID=3702 RepID=A0A7G2ECK5_ARATH|nr:unnamed protein product [Arabidopsis thaliana]